MYQLRALIWRAYKVRLRSTTSSLFDIFGPIVVILIYLGLKFTVDRMNTPQQSNFNSSTHLFRNLNTKPLDSAIDLKRFTCNKVPYYSIGATDSLKEAVAKQCGITLIMKDSRESLIESLKTSLEKRIQYKQPKTNLNRPNTTSGCLTIPGVSEPIYQIGLVMESDRTFQIIMTDSIGSTTVFQPYHQGSSYNEYKFAQSDLNNGLILLETCLANAVINTFVSTSSQNNTNNTIKDQTNGIKWRAKPFPVIGDPIVPVLMFIVCFLLAILCNSMAAILRVAGERENGFHQYVRTSGVSAFSYWMSHFIVMAIHLAIQCLVLAIILAVPVGYSLMDPIHATNMSLRWLLIYAYAMAICSHSLFLGLFVDKQAHAILAITLQATSYAMHFFVIHQYNAFGFTYHLKFGDLILWTPPPLFALLELVSLALYQQTGEPLSMSQLPMGVVGGGVTERSFGDLWLQLILQTPIWISLAIIFDELSFIPNYSPLGIFMSMFDGLCCCCCHIFSPIRAGRIEDLKTKTASKIQQDPYRICCSIRHLNVSGPTGYTAETKGDILDEKNNKKIHFASKTYYLKSHLNSSLQHPDEPSNLNDIVEQQIQWSKAQLGFEDLCIDFRYNQVSFLLGQPDFKELLFSVLLGTSPIKSGHILLDGCKFTPDTICFARSLIGYLGERDIFINELTILENLSLFGSLRDPGFSKFDSESEFLLNLLHLTKRKESRPDVLTHRSARKLALAAAAVGHTKLLLLVEPTLSLRWRPRCQVLNLLKKYKAIRSIVIDTSDIDEATSFGDRIVFLRDGKADMDSSPDQLEKRFFCGHHIVFQYSPGSTKSYSDVLKQMNHLTKDLFTTDRMDDLKEIDSRRHRGSTKNSKGSSSHGGTAMLLKVRYSKNSTVNLIKLINIFEHDSKPRNVKLLELRYESLEDVLVNRMSRATYPDLPPDLLISLTHKNQAVVSDKEDSARSSLRKLISNFPIPKVNYSIYKSSCFRVVYDRLENFREIIIYLLIILFSLIASGAVLIMMKASLDANHFRQDEASRDTSRELGSKRFIDPDIGAPTVYSSMLEQAYRNQIGLIIMNGNAQSRQVNVATNADNNSSLTFGQSTRLDLWPGSSTFSGFASSIMDLNDTSDGFLIASLLNKNKDIPSSFIFFEPDTADANIVFEPFAPKSLYYSIKIMTDYKLTLLSNKLYQKGLGYRSSLNRTIKGTSRYSEIESNRELFDISQYSFVHPWHEMIRGYLTRRFHYAMAFCFVEGLTIGMLLLAPTRHRSESVVAEIRFSYWLAMASFDMSLALVQIFGYVSLIYFIEGTKSVSALISMIIALSLYKIAILPFPYLMSMIIESVRKGWLFIVVFMTTSAWIFGLQLRAFLEWTLIMQGYSYTLLDWMLMLLPLNALIDCLTNINHIERMNTLCPQVPAYTATNHIVELEGVQADTLNDQLIEKLIECLNSGKVGISTNVYNQTKLGILCAIYLMIMFGTIIWMFLMFSERVFGLLTRRFSINKATTDPLKTFVRSSEPTTSLFKWDKEKDRLVNEYIRCINEPKYVRIMTKNCMILRVWFKPMSEHRSIEQRMSILLDALANTGLSRGDIQVELKTTLQLFIRIGTESSSIKDKKIKIIETIKDLAKEYGETISKFALVDWTQEALYKILLHGHYNIRSTPANP